MPFQLLEVKNDSEFQEIMEVHRASFQSGEGLRLWTLIYADPSDIKDDPEGQAVALQEGIKRTIAKHRADPASHWIKVVENDSNRVVGAARWVVATSNPHTSPPVADAFWWPEGEQREFANLLMKQFREAWYRQMQRPHICKY